MRKHLLLRAALVAVGALGLFWALSAVNGLTQASELDTLADLIKNGETIPPDTLDPILARLDNQPGAMCDRKTVPSAIIRLYVAASAEASQKRDAPQLLSSAEAGIRQGLSCSPDQPFLWYGLFWIEMREGRPAEQFIPLLRESYKLGPREGWISYYRNSDALPLFDKLDPQTQDLVKAEYIGMVKDQLSVAAANFKGVAEPVQQNLLKWVADLPIEQRRQFAAALDQADVVADVPGVEYRRGRAVIDPKREN